MNTTYAPHQQRVFEEKAELDLKIVALDKFIHGPGPFANLPHEERVRLNRQYHAMNHYSTILEERITAFGPPSYTSPGLDKPAAVKIHKTFRQRLDNVLQEMKRHKTSLIDATKGPAQNVAEDPGEAIAQHVLSIRDLESAIMRQGMALKYVGNPDPYPQSRNPESPVVEPTADGLKL